MIIIHNNDNRIILDSGSNYKITHNQIDEALQNAEENDVFITQLENNLDAVIYGLKKAKDIQKGKNWLVEIKKLVKL